MKGVAKLIALGIIGLLLVTLGIEVVSFYVNQAKIVGMSTLVLETSVEMSNASLEDGDLDIAIFDSDRTSHHSDSLILGMRDLYESYLASIGENASISYHSNASYNGHLYDYQLTFVRTIPYNYKIKSFNVYIDIEDNATEKIIHSTMVVDCYFHSKLMRGKVTSNLKAGQIYFKDSVNYNIATDQ